MAILTMQDDLNIIAGLGDNPNTDNALDAAGLKAKFDEASNLLKAFLNGTVVPAINKLQALPYTESETYPGCHYRETTDGEIEWLNPPMEDGVAYRTTERYGAAPVYIIRCPFSIRVEDDEGTLTVRTGLGTTINSRILSLNGAYTERDSGLWSSVFSAAKRYDQDTDVIGTGFLAPAVAVETGTLTIGYPVDCGDLDGHIIVKWC